jgi:Protein of unknown function (DUF3999)
MIRILWRTAGLLTLVACSLSTQAAHAVQAVQTVHTETIGQLQLSGSGPYYQLHLPLAWQAQAGTAQANHVRISNAQGEALPYAWAHAPVVAETLQDVRLNWFKWAGPKQHVWVLDTRHLPGHVQQLQLTLPNGQSGMFAFAVDRSEDLQTWARVLPSAQVIRLTTAQGQQLEQTTLVLGSVSPGYLRLRLLPGSPTPVLGDVNVVYSQAPSHMPEWSWSGPLQASSCTATYCDFNVPHQIPLARIKLNLPQVNTVLNLQVLGKPLAEQPQPHPHHGLRKRLRALRDKAHGDDASLHPSSQAQQGWRWINEGQAYWIQQGTQHLRNDELQLDMGNYHQLRIQTTSGASAWAHTRPTLMVATPERSLVFLTKGPAPYRFSWAAPGAASTVMELGQLMPAGTSIAMGQAQLPAIALPKQTTTSPPPKTPQVVASQVSGAEPGIPNAWWLWAALLLGLGLMAYMARVLLSNKPQGQ